MSVYNSSDRLISFGLSVEAEIYRREHAALHGQYQAAIGTIVETVGQGMMLAQAIDTSRTIHDAVVWRIDGDVTDGELNFATRIALKIQPVPKGTRSEKALSTALTQELYKPSKQWNTAARQLGRYGLYVTGIEWRTVKLEIAPQATIFDAQQYAQFTHMLSDPVRYTANPQGGELQSVEPLPPYRHILHTAYNKLILKHAEQALDSKIPQSFTEAANSDRHLTELPVDNLPAYREATKGNSYAAQQIRELAAALCAANDNVLSPELLGQLLSPEVTNIAGWALLNKGAYHTATASWGNPSLHHRLAWVQKVAPEFYAAIHSRVNTDNTGFGEILAADIQRVTQIVKAAGRLCSHIQPPETMSLESPNWQVWAR